MKLQGDEWLTSPQLWSPQLSPLNWKFLPQIFLNEALPSKAVAQWGMILPTGNIWQYQRHSGLSSLGMGCSWHLVGEAEMLLTILPCTGRPLQQGILEMSTMPRQRNPVLEGILYS